MSQYSASPFAPSPVLLVSDHPEWLLGGFNDHTAPTKFQITNVALTSNVATVTGMVMTGPIPAVGGLLSIQGISATNSEFNVTNVAIASVTISASTGQGTITFPLTQANVTSVADAGVAIVPTPITYETLQNGSSVPAATPNNDALTDGARTFQAQVFFGSLPTTATVTVQASAIDQDSAYQTLGTVATVAGGVVTLSEAQFQLTMSRFLRFSVSGVTGGTSPTVAACLLF